MFDFLPDRPKSLDLQPSERLTPLLYAGGLIGIGAALLWSKPSLGHVPTPALTKEGKNPSRSRRVARRGRDAVGSLAPTNVTDSLGRSLVLGGVALMLARLLDEAS